MNKKENLLQIKELFANVKKHEENMKLYSHFLNELLDGNEFEIENEKEFLKFIKDNEDFNFKDQSAPISSFLPKIELISYFSNKIAIESEYLKDENELLKEKMIEENILGKDDVEALEELIVAIDYLLEIFDSIDEISKIINK